MYVCIYTIVKLIPTVEFQILGNEIDIENHMRAHSNLRFIYTQAVVFIKAPIHHFINFI